MTVETPSVPQEEALMREAIMQAVGAMCLGARAVSDLFQTGVSGHVGIRQNIPKYPTISDLLFISF